MKERLFDLACLFSGVALLVATVVFVFLVATDDGPPRPDRVVIQR